MKPPEKIYEFHVANLRAVGDALHRISLSLRRALATDDTRAAFALLRTYALLLAAWAESRLRKLLYEPAAFSESERRAILHEPTELAKWVCTVDCAFRRHYGVVDAPLSVDTLPHSAYARFATILDLLSEDLQPVIQLRNKLAHGQWVYTLNDDGDDVAQAQMDALRLENLLSLQFKHALLGSLSDIINDLVVSRPAFERDFDSHYRRIVQTRRNLRKRSYDQYIATLRVKAERGRVNRVSSRADG